MLQTFVDAFQGHYKDGTEPGTRDCRWFAAVYFLGRIVILYIIFGITQDVLCYTLVGISLLLILLVTVMLQPYKSTKVNNYYISIQLFLAIACFFLLDQATIKDHWLKNTMLQLNGVIIILPILVAIFIITYKICHKVF
jgi:4-amino-4-deoxy-L-arabinose transferase-like glycosyltransferase